MKITVDAQTPMQRAVNRRLVGLAFSGGGIRSATFNLGILQAISQLGHLPSVDYLSTVSGGGYIGSWLISNIQQERDRNSVARMLSPADSPDPNKPEQRPINFLRDYSNYLTPETGMFSADTWTMLMIWIRNTLLNLIILIFTGWCILLVPRLLGLMGKWLAVSALSRNFAVLSFGYTNGLSLLALAFLLPVALLIGLNLRSFKGSSNARAQHWYQKQHWVQMVIVIPVWIASAICSLTLWNYVDRFRSRIEYLGMDLVLPAVMLFLLLMIVQWAGDFHGCFMEDKRLVGWARWGSRPMAFVGFPAVSAVVFWGCFAGITRLMLTWTESEGLWYAITFGTPLFLLAFSLALTVEIGLMGRSFPDDRREWFARLAAWVTIFSAGLTALFAVALFGPLFVAWLCSKGGAWAKTMLPAGWLGTTAAALWSGTKEKPSDGKKPQKPSLVGRSVSSLGPYVFIAGLLLTLTTAIHVILTSAKFGPVDFAVLTGNHWRFIQDTPALYVWLAFIGCGGVAALFSARVDINDFSMHHFYKNRLVRCYLGASRASQRKPHPFIGFDAEDDRRLCTFRHDYIKLTGERDWEPRPYPGPYPIINATLNLVKGDRLSWQERKGSSFVFSPKYCGWHKGSNGQPALVDTAAYRMTNVYAYPHNGWEEGGMGLGTSVAISGAAASPNMGYQSSSALAFLMTVFNVRLGWWLGNPLRSAWQESGPLWGLNYLMTELFGLTNDRRDYVYLSDGGHFENLGIYELVRRRCAVIVACDGEQDGDMTFGGLGNAIRKCRTDFGVEIEIDVRRLVKDEKTGISPEHCAVGTIHYHEGVKGTLVYIKSSLTGDEPADVLEYRSRNSDFPHQTTGDQFFDESQFESYRRLGYHIGMQELHPARLVLLYAASAADFSEEKRKRFEGYRERIAHMIRNADERELQDLRPLIAPAVSDLLARPARPGTAPRNGSANAERTREYYRSLLELMEHVAREEQFKVDWKGEHGALLAVFDHWTRLNGFGDYYTAWKGGKSDRDLERFFEETFALK